MHNQDVVVASSGQVIKTDLLVTKAKMKFLQRLISISCITEIMSIHSNKVGGDDTISWKLYRWAYEIHTTWFWMSY